MEDSRRALLLASGLALATALAARASVPLAAAIAAISTLLALQRWMFPAGLAALPALLCAMTGPTSEPVPPPCGPVRIAGAVQTVHRDPLRQERTVRLATAGGVAMLQIHGDLAVLPGDRVTAIARSTPPSVPGQRHLLVAAADACTVTPGPPSLPRACVALRTALEERLLLLLPGERGLVVAALTLGTGTRVPDDVAAAHRATGLSHLLAVSGAHAAMLAWLLGLQPFGGGRRRPVSRAHLAIALSLLTVYAAITGFEPPVLRALVSYALAAASMQLGRRLSIATALAWPALFSAVVAPTSVLGPSFCLSYAAVFGLGLAGSPKNRSAIETWWLHPVRSSIWATLTTAPFTLWFFAQLAPWTVLLTPLLAPLIGAMLFLGLGTAIAACMSPALGEVLAVPLDAFAGIYLHVVAACDALPGTPVFAWSRPPWPTLLGFTAAGVAAMLVLRGRRGAACLCALPCVPHFLPAPKGQAGVQLFAVGHGQACVATLENGGTLLLDCGSLQHSGLAARRVDQALRRRRIDVAVLTHGDLDHIGGVFDLLRTLPITTAVLPAALRDEPIAHELLASGTACTFLLPGEQLQPLPTVLVLAPAPDVHSDNDDSLWVRVRWNGLELLAAGDAQEAGVAAALALGLAAPADALLLPHHGRRNDAFLDLLAAVKPRLCLCSAAGKDGISELGEQALRSGVPTFTTGVAGDLELRRRGGTWQLTLPSGLSLPAR